MEDIVWLQKWYMDQCNGDWEHDSGIDIRSLDNPGWRVRINLAGTGIEGLHTFERYDVERSETDWCQCWLADDYFEAAAGPMNLSEALSCFRKWVEMQEARTS